MTADPVGRDECPDVSLAALAASERALRGSVAEMIGAARGLAGSGIAEFGLLATALESVERDLVMSDPLHPDGRALREALRARLGDLHEALGRLLGVVRAGSAGHGVPAP